MNEELNLNKLNELLKEKFFIENIEFPKADFNPNAYQKEGIKYTFLNGEEFEGRIEENVLHSGIYKWPNGQIYKGTFSSNYNFKSGEIIFPSGNTLKAKYNEEKKCFENSIYETDTMTYEGNILKNKLHGYSLLQSKPNELLYSFRGKYNEGKRNGKFELTLAEFKIKYKITGVYKYGKKNGNFKVIDEIKNKIIFDNNFINDIMLIEKDNINIITKEKNINCIAIIKKENNIILIIAINNKIILYNIIREIYLKEFNIFSEGKILDIIVLKDNKILLSNDDNKLKLIDIKIDRSNIYLNIIQEFSGNDNSFKILSLLELNNDLIISGDCNNLIFWKKINAVNEIINQSGNSLLNNNEQSIFESISLFCNNCIENIKNFINNEKETEIEIYNLQLLYNINSSCTYSLIEIKKNSENFFLSVAQPDDNCIIIYELSYNNDNNDTINIVNKKKIENIKTIINRKNIMTYKENILYVCCIDSIKLIDISDINNIFILKNFFLDNISYINFYQNDFLIYAINKNKTTYNFESNLIINNIEENDINPIYEKSQHRHNGSIINILVFNYQNKEYIISLGTDKKIIITNNIYKSLDKPYLNNIEENDKKYILSIKKDINININEKENNLSKEDIKLIERNNEINIGLSNSNLINNNVNDMEYIP